MPRKSDQSALDDLFALFKLLPPWIGPFSAILVFVVIRFGVTAWLATRPLFRIACAPQLTQNPQG